MGMAKLIVGLVLLVFNLAISQYVPNYFSSLGQGTIELLQIGFILIGVVSPIIGWLERE